MIIKYVIETHIEENGQIVIETRATEVEDSKGE
jgi:hypothetical protein